MRLLTVQLTPVAFFFFNRRPKYLPCLSTLEHPPLLSSLNMGDQVSHPLKSRRNCISLYFSVCVHKLQTGKQNCGVNGSRHSF